MAVNEDLCYQIPENLRNAMEKYIGIEVDMGVRPEYCQISPDMMKSEGYMCDINIDFVEPQGSHAILISKAGEKEIKIHTTSYMDIEPNTKVSLGVANGRVMFFDCKTTKRIK